VLQLQCAWLLQQGKNTREEFAHQRWLLNEEQNADLGGAVDSLYDPFEDRVQTQGQVEASGD